MAVRIIALNWRNASAVTAVSSVSQPAPYKHFADRETPRILANALMLIASGPPCSTSCNAA
jgi:hypothetical protein